MSQPGYGAGHGQPQQYYEQDLKHLVGQTLDAQADSAKVSRQAAESALQADAMARKAMEKLGRQGAQLDGIDKKLDVMNAELDRADKKATHLVQLNSRPFFIPVSSSVAKASEEASKRPEPQSSSWFSWMGFTSETTPSSDSQVPLGPPPEIKPRTSSLVEYEAKVGAWATQEEQMQSKEYEKQIDEDLDQVSGALDSLKMVGLAIGEETRRQNALLKDMTAKSATGQEAVNRVNKKVKRVLK
ncbi:hypothetical protein HDU67_007140 [Dinochytrium kinnereticum]|nr:hypothetical protein HDU67_007140 [Dinochytrium kinnereticum]